MNSKLKIVLSLVLPFVIYAVFVSADVFIFYSRKKPYYYSALIVSALCGFVFLNTILPMKWRVIGGVVYFPIMVSILYAFGIFWSILMTGVGP